MASELPEVRNPFPQWIGLVQTKKIPFKEPSKDRAFDDVLQDRLRLPNPSSVDELL